MSSSIQRLKDLENYSSITFDENNLVKVYAEDFHLIGEKLEEVPNVDQSGWIPVEGFTLSITTPSGSGKQGTIRVQGTDAVDHFEIGMKITFEQPTAGQQFGVIVTINDFDPNDTYVGVYLGNNYTIASESVSDLSVSRIQKPRGFDLNPASWEIFAQNFGTVSQSNPSAGVWYNLGSINIALPAGIWDVEYQVLGQSARTSGTAVQMFITLSTANNTESNSDYTVRHNSVVANNGSNQLELFTTFNRKMRIVTTGLTTFYLNTQTPGTANTLAFLGASSTTMIRAKSVYL